MVSKINENITDLVSLTFVFKNTSMPETLQIILVTSVGSSSNTKLKMKNWFILAINTSTTYYTLNGQ